MKPLDDVPGIELVERGLADLERGTESAEALLVAIGAPRLRRVGLPVPPDGRLPREPERLLYRVLEKEHGDGAHSAYNALVRRLVSCERALESRTSRRESSR